MADKKSTPRIPITRFPRLRAEVERILGDPERIRASGVHRKTFQRLLAQGMPAYFEPFTLDPDLARALCGDLDQPDRAA